MWATKLALEELEDQCLDCQSYICNRTQNKDEIKWEESPDCQKSKLVVVVNCDYRVNVGKRRKL